MLEAAYLISMSYFMVEIDSTWFVGKSHMPHSILVGA